MDRIGRLFGKRQDAVVAPVAVVPVVPVAPRRTINPILPLLCLALILFLIASTIILALIPVYLQSRDAGRTNLQSSQFTTDILLRNGFLPTGPLSSENCARIQTRLRQQAAASGALGTSVPSVTSCIVVRNNTNTGRRKRQAQTVGNVIRIVVVLSPGNCFSNLCVLSRARALIAFLFSLGDFDLPLILANGTSFPFVAAYISASDVTLVPTPPGSGTSTPSTGTTASSTGTTASSTGTTASSTGTTASSTGTTASSTGTTASSTGTTASSTGTTTITTTSSTTTSTPVSFDIIFLALTTNNVLLAINTLNPGTILDTIPITNLTAGENITNIDFRPATGLLYGTSNRQLYIIDLITFQARAIGNPLSSSVVGNIISIEFDPVFDVIRVVTDAGENIPINPEEGDIFYSPTRPNSTDTAISVAYSNNVAGATTTTLFSIDPDTDALSQLNTQVSSSESQVGSGFGVNITAANGFDISPTGAALAVLQVNESNVLYAVNLTSGTFIQTFGVIDPSIISIAIPAAGVVYFVSSNNNSLGYVNLINSRLVFSYKTITGLQGNETIVSIDMRPFNGQLFGISSASRLYAFDMGTAQLYPTGDGSPFTPSLRGTSFAIDFNPVVDRIRLVSDEGQNLVLNQNTGLVQVVDRDINPSNISITCIAYSNNVANATSTVLYDISTSLSQLFTQTPPASGTLTLVGSLNVALQTCNGFDISSATDTGLGLFTVDGATNVYQVNLTSGEATNLFNNVASSQIISLALGLNL